MSHDFLKTLHDEAAKFNKWDMPPTNMDKTVLVAWGQGHDTIEKFMSYFGCSEVNAKQWRADALQRFKTNDIEAAYAAAVECGAIKRSKTMKAPLRRESV